MAGWGVEPLENDDAMDWVTPWKYRLENRPMFDELPGLPDMWVNEVPLLEIKRILDRPLVRDLDKIRAAVYVLVKGVGENQRMAQPTRDLIQQALTVLSGMTQTEVTPGMLPGTNEGWLDDRSSYGNRENLRSQVFDEVQSLQFILDAFELPEEGNREEWIRTPETPPEPVVTTGDTITITGADGTPPRDVRVERVVGAFTLETAAIEQAITEVLDKPAGSRLLDPKAPTIHRGRVQMPKEPLSSGPFEPQGSMSIPSGSETREMNGGPPPGTMQGEFTDIGGL